MPPTPDPSRAVAAKLAERLLSILGDPAYCLLMRDRVAVQDTIRYLRSPASPPEPPASPPPAPVTPEWENGLLNLVETIRCTPGQMSGYLVSTNESVDAIKRHFAPFLAPAATPDERVEKLRADLVDEKAVNRGLAKTMLEDEAAIRRLKEALARAIQWVPPNAVDTKKAMTHPIAECRTREFCEQVLAESSAQAALAESRKV